ncbi:hypothetical protein ACFV8E_40450 [Streptomyces sp. NPDC059849]|uniref:hypothetical protein n=1 Tax=Streptomyces sp. NPDC059849 TaxID=3346969 RepID=UPI0036631D54
MGVLTLASASGLESDPQLSRLLLWLYESVQQNPSHYVDVRDFARGEGLPEDDSDNMALQLEKLGLVQIARSLAGGLSEVFPTDDGLLEALRLLALRTNVVERSGTPAMCCCAGSYAWAGGKPLFQRWHSWKTHCAASPGIP